MKRSLMLGAVTAVLCIPAATHGGAQLTPTLSQQTLQLTQRWTEEAQKVLNSADLSGKTSILIDLLDRANGVMGLALRETNGVQGVGEGFGSVYDKIFEALWKNGDRNNQRFLDVLVRGSYNPDSPFAVEVARNYGELIAPTLLELVQSDFFMDRMNATGMLGTLLQNSNLQLATRDRVHSAIIKAASDENPAVRISAVSTIGKVGSPVDLTILQRIAANDPESKTGRDSIRRYPVREAAQRAVAEIQKR